MAYGFGGLGASYPTRFGAPVSQQVQSDDEWNGGWKNRISDAQFSVAHANEPIDAGQNYITAAVNAGATIDQALERAGQAAGVSRGLSNYQDIFSPIFGRRDEAVANLSNLQRQYQGEQQGRQENQIAQQQAYNGMIGNGQLNGVLGADYSTPGFGQVNGQITNPFAVDQGADMSWSSGVYNPQSNGQTGVYNPQAAARTFWGL